MKAGSKILEHTPEDMTVTVEAGMTLAALQGELGRHRQWLPLDPPHAERLTLGELINTNVSGPRRFGCGTIRDFLIGIKVALADGTIIHSGGKVVKNVAGYDLLKLFIGAQGSLGTVVETTFKLRPLPESERFNEARCESLEQADKLIEAVIKSDVTPTVLDLHNLPTSSETVQATVTPEPIKSPVPFSLSSGKRAGVNKNFPFAIVLGFAGTREEVEWQLTRASELGFKESSSLDYAAKFWTDTAPAHRLSVLPSKMVAAIHGLQGFFVARAGNGVIYHRGPATPRHAELPLDLMRRVKAAYDPKSVLPELPL